MKIWPAVLLLSCAGVQAQTAVCHVDYGGETRSVRAAPTAAPYVVPTLQVGSYFLFRLVFEERVAVKTYVYADRDAGPLPLHQATFSLPLRNTGPHGFSGRHLVYEPVRDGELGYWCELD